jgi:lysophospholipase L1-like esterase
MNEIEIKESDLRVLLDSDTTTPEELHKYFEPDLNEPFTGNLRLRDNIVVIPDEETTHEISLMGSVITLANNWARKKRNKKYRQKIKDEPDAVRIISEGDSWFQHPHPKVLDIVDQLSNHYPVYCIGAAGDTVRNMFYEGEFLQAMKDESPKIFLISGGGNDILGDSFRNYLNDAWDAGEPGKLPERFLKENFQRELESIGNIYRVLFEKLKDKPIDVIVHGYDYVIPLDVNDKGWVGRYMIEKRIENKADRRAVINYMMDRFNEKLSSIASEYPNVHYIDLRKTVRDDQWFDEIHPTSDGFQDLALKYHTLIQKIVKKS